MGRLFFFFFCINKIEGLTVFLFLFCDDCVVFSAISGWLAEQLHRTVCFSCRHRGWVRGGSSGSAPLALEDTLLRSPLAQQPKCAATIVWSTAAVRTNERPSVGFAISHIETQMPTSSPQDLNLRHAAVPHSAEKYIHHAVARRSTSATLVRLLRHGWKCVSCQASETTATVQS